MSARVTTAQRAQFERSYPHLRLLGTLLFERADNQPVPDDPRGDISPEPTTAFQHAPAEASAIVAIAGELPAGARPNEGEADATNEPRDDQQPRTTHQRLRFAHGDTLFPNFTPLPPQG